MAPVVENHTFGPTLPKRPAPIVNNPAYGTMQRKTAKGAIEAERPEFKNPLYFPQKKEAPGRSPLSLTRSAYVQRKIMGSYCIIFIHTCS